MILTQMSSSGNDHTYISVYQIDLMKWFEVYQKEFDVANTRVNRQLRVNFLCD